MASREGWNIYSIPKAKNKASYLYTKNAPGNRGIKYCYSKVRCLNGEASTTSTSARSVWIGKSKSTAI